MQSYRSEWNLFLLGSYKAELSILDRLFGIDVRYFGLVISTDVDFFRFYCFFFSYLEVAPFDPSLLFLLECSVDFILQRGSCRSFDITRLCRYGSDGCAIYGYCVKNFTIRVCYVLLIACNGFFFFVSFAGLPMRQLLVADGTGISGLSFRSTFVSSLLVGSGPYFSRVGGLSLRYGTTTATFFFRGYSATIPLTTVGLLCLPRVMLYDMLMLMFLLGCCEEVGVPRSRLLSFGCT